MYIFFCIFSRHNEKIYKRNKRDAKQNKRDAKQLFVVYIFSTRGENIHVYIFSCIFSRHTEKIYVCRFTCVYFLDTRRKYTGVDLLVYIFSGQKENKGGEVGEVR